MWEAVGCDLNLLEQHICDLSQDNNNIVETIQDVNNVTEQGNTSPSWEAEIDELFASVLDITDVPGTLIPSSEEPTPGNPASGPCGLMPP